MPPEEGQGGGGSPADLEDLLSSGEGIAALVVLALVALGALVFSGAFLVILARRRRPVPLPTPRWGGPEALLALVGWVVSQGIVAGFAQLALPLSGSMGTILRLALIGIAALAYTGLLLAIPAVVGQSLVAVGIGVASVARGAFQGVVVWLCSLPMLLAVLYGSLVALLLLGVEPEPQEPVEIFLGGVARGEIGLAITVLAFGVVVAPIVEEVLFRGIVHRWIAARRGAFAGAILSGALFGLVHLSVFAFVPITLLGIILALVLERTGNLWACIALHAVFNAGQFALMFAFHPAAG